MKVVLFSLFLLVCLESCTSVKTHNTAITKQHTVAALHADVDKLYEQLKKHHPRLYQYTSKKDLEFQIDSVKQTITKPLTSRAFYKKVVPVFMQVRQGHLSLRPSGKRFTRSAKKVLKKKKFEFYDLDFEYLEGKLWVKRTVGKDSSFVGAEVLKVANTPVDTLVETYKKRFASDGFNTSLYNRAIGRFFKVLYVRDKGFLDSLKLTFKLKDSTFTKLFKRISKKTKKKKEDTLRPLQDSLKQKKEIQPLSKVALKARRLAKKKQKKKNKVYGFIPRSKDYTRNFNFIGSDTIVGYMKIRGFSNGNYKTFYKESFKKLDSAKAKHLIIDLRDNGGGRVAEVKHLYSYLAKAPFQFLENSEVANRMPFFNVVTSNTSPVLVKSIATLLAPFFVVHSWFKIKKDKGYLYYRFKSAKLEQPKPLRFKGKIYVLINGNSFSASSLIATHLKASQRATFVGEETGGAYNGCVAGFYKIYKLPTTKLIARIGVMQLEAPYKQTPDGYGVTPDVEILSNVIDREQQKDVELEWILNNIKE